MRGGAALGARLWWGLPLLVVLLWSVSVLSVASLPGLPVAPLVTQVGLPMMRFARDVSAVLTVGTLIVGGLLTGRREPSLMRWATGWALAWLASLLALLALTLSDIRADSPIAALEPTSLLSFLAGEAIGHVFALQALAVVAVVGLTLAKGSTAARWTAAAVAVAASAAPAFLGHADAVHSHAGATISLAFHIAAVSVWVGGLAALVGLVGVDVQAGARAIPRFSLLALGCVIVVAESGLLNASLRVGGPSSFVSTPYGALVLAKVVLLGALVWAGWLQRRRAVPDASVDPTAGLLVRLAAWEFVAMGSALAVSITLSRLGPGPAPGGAPGTFLPLAASLLALAGGLLLAWSMPPAKDRRWVQRVRSAPEVLAIVLLVVVVEVTGVGLLNAALGSDLAAVVGSALLVAAGWLWAVAAADRRALASILVLAVGWPLAIWLSVQLDGSALSRLDLLSLLLAESLLALAWWRIRLRATASERTPATVGA